MIGLLPLYIELYDVAVPHLRPQVEKHLSDVADALAATGLTVLSTPVCRLEREFHDAVRGFEQAGADAIVTLHLAYSPSLESEAALCGTSLPLIVLDTTPDDRFDEDTDPSAMMFNHGIHGVQDMCNRLIRQGKAFEIHAGHLKRSDVLVRVHRSAHAALLVSELRRARVGLVGDPFVGMGDFRVDFEELRRDLGPVVIRADGDWAPAVSEAAIAAEMAADRTRFTFADALTPQSHEASTRAGLALREWVERADLTAVTVNFMSSSSSHQWLTVMPFLECSKVMGRGLGYAGEGDVLTAAWVGALLQCFPDATFTEMFCPDWVGGSVFLSHMGELNYDIAESSPRLTTMPFPYTDAADPAVAYGTYREGEAILANLAPLGDGEYRLVLAPGRIRATRAENKMSSLVNGWFVPASGLIPFLEDFSRQGGTHHSALLYTSHESLALLTTAARFLGIEVAVV